MLPIPLIQQIWAAYNIIKVERCEKQSRIQSYKLKLKAKLMGSLGVRIFSIPSDTPSGQVASQEGQDCRGDLTSNGKIFQRVESTKGPSPGPHQSKFFGLKGAKLDHSTGLAFYWLVPMVSGASLDTLAWTMVVFIKCIIESRWHGGSCRK